MAGPKNGITADRKNSSKLDFIVDKYNEMTREELATYLNETPRWIKRQISTLKKSGKITPKRPLLCIHIDSDWTDDIKNRTIYLRRAKLMPSHEISEVLKKEFSFDINGPALEFWFKKWGCPSRSKEDWLEEFFPKEKMIDLIDSGYRVKDISDIIKKTHDVYISDDIVLVYLQSKNIESQKNRRIRVINEKADSFSKEWLNEQVQGHAALSGLTSKMGVSKTVVMHRLNAEGISLIRHRKIWSNNLEILRDHLLNSPPMLVSISEEDRHQMFMGWLLGDGHLDFNGRFVVNHSLVQLSYLYVKYQVLRDNVSNIVTVPAAHYAGDGKYLGGKEQMGLSCPGFEKYIKYLNVDGSKNFSKIADELSDLGWACYYMDDGSYFFGGQIMALSARLASIYQNTYRFGKIVKDCNLEVSDIKQEYLIPCMSDKSPGYGEFYGDYWKDKFPELFEVAINNDFDLCLVNNYICAKNPDIMTEVVDYYHKRGFPVYQILDVYLSKEWEKLLGFNSSQLWKDPGIMRYLVVGNAIYKHFMPHMVEAKYRNVSPKQTFDNYATFITTLTYTLKAKKSILPDFVHDNLVHFNGGVVGFPCSVAKAVADKYCPEGGVIVDPCSGWGGRLLGVSAANRKYYGFEPWDKTHSGLKNIIKNFSLKESFVINSDFDPEKAPDVCDLVFTSPPYIDLEIYGSSFTKEDWLRLMASIFHYSEDHLKVGGSLILNLPKYLRGLLPVTTLKEEPSVYWNTSSKVRTLDKAECLYIWTKGAF